MLDYKNWISESSFQENKRKELVDTVIEIVRKFLLKIANLKNIEKISYESYKNCEEFGWIIANEPRAQREREGNLEGNYIILHFNINDFTGKYINIILDINNLLENHGAPARLHCSDHFKRTLPPLREEIERSMNDLFKTEKIAHKFNV